MDKITVVCHKDHVVGYEDYRDQCLLCVVEDLMREIGRLTAECKEKEWVGLTDEERFKIARDTRPYVADTMKAHEEELKRRNT